MQEGARDGRHCRDAQQGCAKGLLPIDILVCPDILDAVDAIKPTMEYTNKFRIGGAKITIDGSPQGRMAWLTKPYFKPPTGKEAGYLGYPVDPKGEGEAAFDLAYANNWQILTHANGDAAIDVLIGAVHRRRRSTAATIDAPCSFTARRRGSTNCRR